MLSSEEASNLYSYAVNRDKNSLQLRFEEWLLNNDSVIDQMIRDAANAGEHKVFIHSKSLNLDYDIKVLFYNHLQRLGYKIQETITNFYIVLT